ncbi:MAG: VCBS repeat-containing protein [Mariniblastus sp.]|nr:VCBS repeat-containing protein [Mariniblastus sp.]
MQMKNFISTLAMLFIFFAIAIVTWLLSRQSEEREKLASPLNAEVNIEGMLDPDKQKVIWDAEHMTFEIESRICKPFVKAWASRKTDHLRTFFRDSPILKIPNEIEWNCIQQPPLEQRTRTPSDQQLREAANFQEFSDQISMPLKDIKIDQKKLRVLKIADLGDKNWQLELLLSGSGKDHTGQSLQYQSKSDVIVVIEDEEQLGEIPAIMSWKIKNETIRICTEPLMGEITSALGLDNVQLDDNWILGKGKTNQHNFQIAIEDFDLDNDFDIAVMSLNKTRKVLAYQDGKYVDVTKELGIAPTETGPHTDAIFSTAWIDIDNDGFPELISGAKVFKNEAGKTFSDITADTHLTFAPETMGLNVVDFNNDGFLDLYVLYQRPFGRSKQHQTESSPQQAKWVDESGTGKENQLFKNNRDGSFSNVTELTDASGGKCHTHAAAWFFYNDDHYPDLYIANDFGKNTLLVSRENGGYFEDVSSTSGSDGFATSMGVVAGDINNDGQSDLYVANMFSKMGRRIIAMVSEEDYEPEVYRQILGSCAGNRLYCWNGNEYEDRSVDAGVNEVGWAWAPTMLDINSDGLLDLYSTAGFMSFDRERPDG